MRLWNNVRLVFLATAVTACGHVAPSSTNAGDGDHSYTERGVEVILETIDTPLQNPATMATVSPETSQPSVNERVAVDTAWNQREPNATPQTIIVGYVNWDASPAWVVSFQGGQVCVPMYGAPEGSDPTCVNENTVVVDATSGDIIRALSHGIPVPVSQLGSSPAPLPTLAEIIQGTEPGGSDPDPPSASGSG
jgi:hypothetical protein